MKSEGTYRLHPWMMLFLLKQHNPNLRELLLLPKETKENKFEEDKANSMKF